METLQVSVEKLVDLPGKHSAVQQIAGIASKAFKGMKDLSRARESINSAMAAFPQTQYFLAMVKNPLEPPDLVLEKEIASYILWEQWGGPDRPDGDVWELKQLATKEEYRGHAIALRLILDSLAGIKEYIRARGSWLKNVVIFTGADNKAQKIYQETLDAQVVATVPGLYGDRDEVMMIARFEKAA